MTVINYRTELQKYADQQWPDVGIEVRVEIWRPAGVCERCGATLERRQHTATGGNGGLYVRVGEFEGQPIRSPHHAFACERVNT